MSEAWCGCQGLVVCVEVRRPAVGTPARPVRCKEYTFSHITEVMFINRFCLRVAEAGVGTGSSSDPPRPSDMT